MAAADNGCGSAGHVLGGPGCKYTVKRKYCDGIKTLGADSGEALARMHADAARWYRRAALVSTRSLIQTCRDTARRTLAGVAHLLAVSYAVEGEWDQAKKYSVTARHHPMCRPLGLGLEQELSIQRRVMAHLHWIGQSFHQSWGGCARVLSGVGRTASL